MLVRVNANTSYKSVPTDLTGLVGETSLWHEFKYQRGTEVFGEAEPAEYVYQLRAGAVRTYKLLSDGRRQIGGFHLPGDIFGLENGDVHRFTADAIIDTTVWLAKRESVFGGLTEVGAATATLKLVNRSLEHAENHLLLLGRQTALEKTAAFLLEMDRRLQQPSLMILPMCRRDIADYLGLTLETVSRALSTLRDRGILSLEGKMQRKIALHDRTKLAEIALAARVAGGDNSGKNWPGRSGRRKRGPQCGLTAPFLAAARGKVLQQIGTKSGSVSRTSRHQIEGES